MSVANFTDHNSSLVAAFKSLVPPSSSASGRTSPERMSGRASPARASSPAPYPPLQKYSPANSTTRNLRTASQLFSLRPKDTEGVKYALIMVGLPARGKSFISHKMKRWLNWLGYPTRVFNVGNARRQVSKSESETAQKLGTTQESSFFNPNDPEKCHLRDHLAMQVLDEMIEWLHSGLGNIGIHDATNTTIARRNMVLERLSREPDIETIFVESICTDPTVLERNIGLKAESPDYKNVADKETARADFIARLKNYEQAYQPIPEDTEDTYIKIINVGRRVIANNICGYIPGQIVFYLMNIHIVPRKILLVRAGDTRDSITGRLGRDLPLNEDGVRFGRLLSEHVRTCYPELRIPGQIKPEHLNDPNVLQIWSSALVRAIQTAKMISPINYKVVRSLNELNIGGCEGMTKEEIKEKMPTEYEARETDKLAYRYPDGGESYIDVIERLRPLIVELERQRNSILIVSHSAVLRTIYSYFMDVSTEEVPFIDIPPHTVISLDIGPYATRCSTTAIFDNPTGVPVEAPQLTGQ